MTKKQYRRQMDYKNGYIRGYYDKKHLPPKERLAKSEEYKRGYTDALRDLKDGEMALFPR